MNVLLAICLALALTCWFLQALISRRWRNAYHEANEGWKQTIEALGTAGQKLAEHERREQLMHHAVAERRYPRDGHPKP